jgi:hypothetical protein
MNTTTSRRRKQITSCALIVIAAGIAWSGLIAQTQTPTPSGIKTGECKDWPPGQDPCDAACHTAQVKVAAVFETLIKEASDGSRHGLELRRKLLDPSDCWKKAYEIVAQRLKGIVPFGSEHHVIFYEPEGPMDSRYGEPLIPKFPNNHCLHILWLPDASTWASSATPTPTPPHFKAHLRCCYQPW